VLRLNDLLFLFRGDLKLGCLSMNQVKDVETMLKTVESFVWGQPVEVLWDIATYDINRDSLATWSGSPSHTDFSTFLQGKIKRSAAFLVRYVQQLLAAQRDNHALVTLANAKLTGTTDPVLQEGLSVIGLTDDQVCWKRLQCDDLGHVLDVLLSR
jgi:hypothetical protein